MDSTHNQERRNFLKWLGAGMTGSLASGLFRPAKLKANTLTHGKEFVGMLVDTTRCIGCRSCEAACAVAHGLPVPDVKNKSVFKQVRKTSETQLTVVNRYSTERGDVYVKTQCMHCNQPACAAACLVKAMEKTKDGPVIWNTNCMGCRLCMVSCPFDIPKFEYASATPKIQKCDLCWDKLKEGEQPVCVQSCPMDAIIFGTRREVLDEAKKRIYQQPDKYVHHIYGEHEVGGTGYMYLASVPFEQLGFKTNLGTQAYPELSAPFLFNVPIILLLWPAFLIGVSSLTRKGKNINGREHLRSLIDIEQKTKVEQETSQLTGVKE